ncbi:hypothetical protein FJZ18_00425 [Candidatus Pacearchaeota archaeon]|nr:hypothetical protein [Candidatus Pacearchaeota archaeon]
MGNDIRGACEEVASTILANYESCKYRPEFTLWGVCYNWSNKGDRWEDIIPSLFDQARANEESVLKPNFLIPKSSNPINYYSMLSMRNSPLVGRLFLSNLVQCPDTSSLREIILDRTLLREAANEYLVELQRGPGLDFFEYMMKGTDNRQGRFSPLLERLLFRFEQSTDLLSELEPLLDSELYKNLEESHRRSLKSKEVIIDPDLKAVRDCYAERIQAQPELPKSQNDALSLKSVFGKIRVKTSTIGSGFIDWESFANMRSAGRVLFNPNAVLRQQLVNLVLNEMLPVYAISPGQAYELISLKYNSAGEEERKALNIACQLFQSMESFQNDSRIHHTINVGRKE